MNTPLTLAGATVSVAITAISIRTWWKGSRDIKALLPFGGTVIVGAGWTMCIGGLFGWFAAQAVSANNMIGGKGVSIATGAKGGGTLDSGSLGTLTYPGACAALVVSIIGGIVLKAACKADKKRMAGGLLVGLTLCATAGVAELMQWVPDMYNAIGHAGENLMNGKMSL